ncbi:MAG: hypothetical protein V1739_04315 [Candidatus Omnitrophota bacterium]
MSKEEEIMDFLKKNIFDPIMCCPSAHEEIEAGVRRTITAFQAQNAAGMIEHFWKSIRGTDGSIAFSGMLKQHGFKRFEDVLDEFRMRFNNEWLKSK